MNRSVLITALLISGVASAQQITVAAASDLQFVLPDVAARFQKDTGQSVKLVFGSSGNFFAQIQNGAPFDVFFSADIDYPWRLEAAGLAEPGTLYEYAIGRIVLWVPTESKVDVSHGLKALLDPEIKKIAIANPEHAPYGRAAVAALKHENIYDQVSGKLVLGENIAQTASLVVSGGADVGIIALSLAVAPSTKDKGRFAAIPDGDYPVIEQAAVVLKASHSNDAAKRFLAYIQTPEIQAILRSYGFDAPGASGASDIGAKKK
jgi:molybdate transport system substrate-binding protein